MQSINDDIRKELNTQKKQIEWLLKTDERCRNSDKWLTWRFLNFYTSAYIPFDDFKKIPAFANAQKIRQVIQNKENKFLPTDPKVRERRGIRDQEVKDVIKDWHDTFNIDK